MKQLISVVLLLLSISAVACARNVILAWDDSQTGVSWNAYRAQGDCGIAEEQFQKINSTPITDPDGNDPRNYTDQNVPFGVLAYRVTAVGEGTPNPQESTFSNCAFVEVTPSSPQNLRLTLDPP